MPDRILICTDLDRTLLPNGSHPESPLARTVFRRLVARPEVTLAYVSGRHRELVEEAMTEYNLPVPDWVIGDVGTTIYQVHEGEWRHWPQWEQEIAPDWRGLTSAELRPLFSDMAALRLQEASKQNRYKLSYYLSLPVNIDVLEQQMGHRLNERNLAANFIFSRDESTSTGLLDLLPARATKLHALEFLMRKQRFDCRCAVFAGDSGNDLAVLISRIPSVLVANASSEVAAQAQKLARQQGTQPALYLAQGGFLGMNGNYSAGILEGIAYYLPFTRHWMEHDDASPPPDPYIRRSAFRLFSRRKPRSGRRSL